MSKVAAKPVYVRERKPNAALHEILAKLDRMPALPAPPTWAELARYGMTTVSDVKKDARGEHVDAYGISPCERR